MLGLPAPFAVFENRRLPGLPLVTVTDTPLGPAEPLRYTVIGTSRLLPIVTAVGCIKPLWATLILREPPLVGTMNPDPDGGLAVTVAEPVVVLLAVNSVVRELVAVGNASDIGNTLPAPEANSCTVGVEPNGGIGATSWASAKIPLESSRDA
jgi:hypothetical protein